MASGTFWPGTVSGSARITGTNPLPPGVSIAAYRLRVDLYIAGILAASSGEVEASSASVSAYNDGCEVGCSVGVVISYVIGTDGLIYTGFTTDAISGVTTKSGSSGAITTPLAGAQDGWPTSASGTASSSPSVTLTDLTTGTPVTLGALAYAAGAWSISLPVLTHGHDYRLTLQVDETACTLGTTRTRDFLIPATFIRERAWDVVSVIGPAVVQSWAIVTPIRRFQGAAWAIVTQINSPLVGAPSAAAIGAALRPLHTFRARLYIKWDRTNWTEETERLIDAAGVDDLDLRMRAPNSCEASFSLDNTDNRFTLTNRHSPIAPNLPRLGQEVRLIAGYDGNESTVFHGFGESLVPTMGDRMAVIRALDRSAQWRSIRSSLPPQVLQTTDTLARALLTGAGFTEGVDFALDVGDVIVPYAVAPDTLLLPELQALVQAEGGRGFFDENGAFQFWSGSHTRRMMAMPTAELTTDDHLYEIGRSTSPTGLATRVSMEWLTRDYTGIPEIVFDSKVVFRIPKGYFDSATGKYMPGPPVVIRAAPMDLTRWERFVPAEFTSLNTLTVNTLRDGSGSVVSTSYGTAPTQTDTQGVALFYQVAFGVGHADVTFENSRGSDVFVRVLKLNGTPQRSISPTLVTVADPDAAEDIELVLSNPYTPDADVASDRVRGELALRKDPLSRLDIPLTDGLPFLRTFDVLRIVDHSIPGSPVTVDGQVLRNSWSMSADQGYTQNLILGSALPAQFRALASNAYAEAAAAAVTDGNPAFAWGPAAHPLVWSFGQWSGYREYLMSLNPIAYWRLGEASGTVAVDEVGANNGTYVGSPTLGAAGALSGDPNTAMNTGAGKYMTSVAGGFTTAGDWTFGAWMRPNVLNSLGMAFLVGSPSVGVEFGIGNGAGGAGAKLQIGIVNKAWVNGLYTFPDTATWHLVLLTRDTATIRAYVDGAEVATSAVVPYAATGAVSVGSHAGIAYPFLGGIDEPAIWNRALTPAEIVRLYELGATP